MKQINKLNKAKAILKSSNANLQKIYKLKLSRINLNFITKDLLSIHEAINFAIESIDLNIRDIKIESANRPKQKRKK